MTESMTLEQAIEIAKDELTKKFNAPFTELVQRVKKEAKFEYGCYYNTFRANNQVKLFYTSNDNFANGRRNGYGAGVYLTISAINLRKDILICR